MFVECHETGSQAGGERADDVSTATRSGRGTKSGGRTVSGSTSIPVATPLSTTECSDRTQWQIRQCSGVPPTFGGPTSVRESPQRSREIAPQAVSSSAWTTAIQFPESRATSVRQATRGFNQLERMASRRRSRASRIQPIRTERSAELGSKRPNLF